MNLRHRNEQAMQPPPAQPTSLLAVGPAAGGTGAGAGAAASASAAAAAAAAGAFGGGRSGVDGPGLSTVQRYLYCLGAVLLK